MANNGLVERRSDCVGASGPAARFARFAGNGAGRHPHATALAEQSGASATRDLADAVHLLCQLHGRHPGLLDLAVAVTVGGPVSAWLAAAATEFERERLYLARLTSAVGPQPSTPGARETEAALLAQRHALETLARSERRGCAVGAAAALIADWRSVRPLLDRAASRVGIPIPPANLPDEASVAALLAEAGDGMAVERALGFGAEQLLLQHRGLFDLLEARASARAAS